MEQITKLAIDKNNERLLNQEYTIDLGTNSVKTALLLNYLFSKVKDFCITRVKYRRWGSEKDQVGGGLLVKAGARVMIDDFDRVTVYFDNVWKADKYIRVAEGKTAVRKAIMDKIANELKKVWRYWAVNDKLQLLYKNKPEDGIKGCCGILDSSTYNRTDYLDLKGLPTVVDQETGHEFVEVSLNEYRALYEFLKGRDQQKVKKRNGVTAWDSMIGKPIEDPFILSAVETIQNEIKKAKEEFNNQYKEAESEKETAISLAQNEFKEKISNFQKEMNAKIAELNNQKNEMLKMVNVATAI